MQLLLDNGADVNAQGGKYGNALKAASSEGHEDVAQLLRDWGAVLEEEDKVQTEDDSTGNLLRESSKPKLT